MKNKKKAFLLQQGELVNIFVILIHAAKILDSKYTRAIFSILYHISQVSLQRELYIKISGIEGCLITFSFSSSWTRLKAVGRCVAGHHILQRSD